MTDQRSASPRAEQLDTARPHSAKPPEDLVEDRSIRFHFRGDHDLIECRVSWEVLDRLEGSPAASPSDRLARFEQHRALIEAAALRKMNEGSDAAAAAPLRLDAGDVGDGPAV